MVAALTRVFGVPHIGRRFRAITERDRLVSYPFYAAALGELELRLGQHRTARTHFLTALALARNPMERQFLERRIGACERARR
jgi:RNA polymerase sigma-70 factor (ECF subfamily)